jgi:hypothetical protein
MPDVRVDTALLSRSAPQHHPPAGAARSPKQIQETWIRADPGRKTVPLGLDNRDSCTTPRRTLAMSGSSPVKGPGNAAQGAYGGAQKDLINRDRGVARRKKYAATPLPKPKKEPPDQPPPEKWASVGAHKRRFVHTQRPASPLNGENTRARGGTQSGFPPTQTLGTFGKHAVSVPVRPVRNRRCALRTHFLFAFRRHLGSP